MAQALAKQGGQTLSQRLNMTEAQLELIRRMCVHPDAPDDVVELYLFRCKSVGCDPMDKMIYVIPRSHNVKDEKNDRWTREIRWTFQGSIDLFRSVAEAAGDYAGQLGPFWTVDGVNWVDVWLDDEPPKACRVGILRQSFKEPMFVTGTYAYYVPRDGKGNPAPTSFWKGEKGAHQLAKCVEELALRKAFPRKLHGIYGQTEMEQAEKPAALPARGKAAKAAEAAPVAAPEQPALEAAYHEVAEPEPPAEEPAAPAVDNAATRASAAQACVRYASSRKIPDEHRHELAIAWFGQPSTKELSTPDLRKLYELLVRYKDARGEIDPEAKGPQPMAGFEAWLAEQIEREAKGT